MVEELNTWTDAMMEVVINSDFGWLANLLPLIIVIGIAWALSTKDVDMTFSLFPLALIAKIIFPFFHASFVVVSFALFIMNVIGSKGDMLADVKAIPQKTRDILFRKLDLDEKARKAVQAERSKELLSKLKDKWRNV